MSTATGPREWKICLWCTLRNRTYWQAAETVPAFIPSTRYPNRPRGNAPTSIDQGPALRVSSRGTGRSKRPKRNWLRGKGVRLWSKSRGTSHLLRPSKITMSCWRAVQSPKNETVNLVSILVTYIGDYGRWLFKWIISDRLLKEEKMTCPESTDAMLKELKEKDLARRVYARFLLNAWRRKREQLASYSECIRHLENQVRIIFCYATVHWLIFGNFRSFTRRPSRLHRRRQKLLNIIALKKNYAQVHQLQLQTTFLRNLRENESARRTEASLESKKLETELEEKSIECRRAVEEKEAYEIVVRNLEITVGRLQNEIERGRKEAASQQSEKYDLQEQIGREREKKLNLMNEKQCLLEKVSA